jgi:hypothetical protein
VKKNQSTNSEAVFSANNYATGIYINDTYGPGEIVIDFSTGTTSGTRTLRYTSAVFRDFSSWYHIVVAVDTTQAVDSDRMKLYVNGVQQALDNAAVGTWPVLNAEGHINSTVEHVIGYRRFTSDYRFNGYLADIHFIDGQALDPSDFGEFDTNGVWQPIEYAGTYGTGTTVATATGALPVFNTTDTYGFVKGSGTRTDSNSASIVLALPMDGTNGGTSFGDQSAVIKGSGSAKTVTVNGNTNTSTAVSKFYGSSGYFDGTGDTLTATIGSSDLSANFTIEGWVYHTSLYNYITWASTTRGATGFNIGTDASGIVVWYSSGGRQIQSTSGAAKTNCWQHFAYVRNGTTLTAYFDGISVGSATVSTNFSATALSIGGLDNTAEYLTGYLSDVRIYSAAKYTSNFTPVNPTNSFHLPFSDNSTAAALGTDTSSNGNDWTVNNIIADFSPSAWDYSQNWATYLTFTTDGGGFISGRSPGEVCFDGTRVKNAATNTTGTSAYIEVSGLSLTASDTLELTLITNNPGSLTWQVTGTNLTTTNISTDAGQFVEILITGAATTFRVSSTSSARAHLTAIRINGKELILPSYPSGIDSLVDSPVNGSQVDTGVGGEVVGNYATWNPLDQKNSNTFSNGNLDCAIAGSGEIFGTQGVSSGKWYFEIVGTATADFLGRYAVTAGIANLALTQSSRSSSGSWMYYTYTGQKYSNGSFSSYGNQVALNDVLGVAVDLDNSKIWFSINNTWQASGDPAAGTNAAFTNVSGVISPAVINGSSNSTNTFVLNTGSRPFANPAPSGFKALCTTNLPEPTIADGSTVMDVVAYSGSAAQLNPSNNA